MANLANIDFYLTLGNSSAQTPLKLNGQSFSLKVGFLVNKAVHTDILGGHSANNRVIKRIRST